MPRSGTVRGMYFYPRSPCGERRYRNRDRAQLEQFLSTLSLRRATVPRLPMAAQPQNISIHALLAESDIAVALAQRGRIISIHALLAESDSSLRPFKISMMISIHALLAESDGIQSGAQQATAISIHALLAESDRSSLIRVWMSWDFYPRSPCGERPRAGSPRLRPRKYFYPRSPCGERLSLILWQHGSR